MSSPFSFRVVSIVSMVSTVSTYIIDNSKRKRKIGKYFPSSGLVNSQRNTGKHGKHGEVFSIFGGVRYV
jgi:hypothetical protein